MNSISRWTEGAGLMAGGTHHHRMWMHTRWQAHPQAIDPAPHGHGMSHRPGCSATPTRPAGMYLICKRVEAALCSARQRQQIIGPTAEHHGRPHHHLCVGALAAVLDIAQCAGPYQQQRRQLLLGKTALLPVAPKTMPNMVHAANFGSLHMPRPGVSTGVTPVLLPGQHHAARWRSARCPPFLHQPILRFAPCPLEP